MVQGGQRRTATRLVGKSQRSSKVDVELLAMIIQLVDLLQSMSFSRLLSIYLFFLVPQCFFLRMLRAEALFQHRWDDFDEVPELVDRKVHWKATILI
jgi:hypothetical protein